MKLLKLIIILSIVMTTLFCQAQKSSNVFIVPEWVWVNYGNEYYEDTNGTVEKVFNVHGSCGIEYGNTFEVINEFDDTRFIAKYTPSTKVSEISCDKDIYFLIDKKRIENFNNKYYELKRMKEGNY